VQPTRWAGVFFERSEIIKREFGGWGGFSSPNRRPARELSELWLTKTVPTTGHHRVNTLLARDIMIIDAGTPQHMGWTATSNLCILLDGYLLRNRRNGQRVSEYPDGEKNTFRLKNPGPRRGGANVIVCRH